MDSRDAILAALRRNAPAPVELPDLSGLGAKPADPVRQFEESLAGVGGACLRVPDLAAADAALREIPFYAAARKVVSLVPGLGRADLDLGSMPDPHALQDVDVAVLPGEFAVAENGAVWLEGRRLHHRALFVITDHLVLVVGVREIVADMHEAYARLEGRERAYGLFISGPSKTADIEQALVIGAQGARSCTVFLVG
ncbi:MAG TPA: LUD domain-containing protein [Vicinamibacteria bacterium]|nr:LUD domain-containing protein [Vicinamibacteria bacterium]